MGKLPYSIHYRIGRFIIGMYFDDKAFHQDLLKYMDTVFPDSRTFKVQKKGSVSCSCSFLSSRKKQNLLKGHRLILSKYHLEYSKDFRRINIFLNDDSRENIKGSIPYLLYFIPFFLKNNAFIEHCSSVIYKGYGFAFIGDPDAGKSTIARILSQKGAKILSDEMAILYPGKGRYFISPVWISSSDKKINIIQSGPVELKTVFFLHKDKNFSLRKLSFYDKVTMLYRNNFTFFMRKLGMQEDFCQAACGLFARAGCFELKFDLSPRIFALLDNLISNGGADDENRKSS